MGREPGLPPPSATAHGIQFCAPTHRVTVIPDFAQIKAPRVLPELLHYSA